jgi:redox-sensitive bicupin YhaK (pirin superfamily)
MSQEAISTEGCTENPTKGISLIINPIEKDLGGFWVRRLIPFAKQRSVGPWIFFDHMGPADFPPGEGMDVRPHPHIGLATVTYMFEGEIVHRDSLGCVQTIQPGAINLMGSGKGIVHSERTGDEARANGQRVCGLQLWLALPEELQEMDPEFLHYPSDDIPAIDVEGVAVRVMIGEAYGQRSPVKQYSDTQYVEAAMPAGTSLSAPQNSTELALYPVEGSVEVNGIEIKQHHMAILDTSCELTLVASEDCRIAMIGGEPLGERHLFWNLVSTSRERVEQAKQDWKEGRFDKVPGETEFIPLPE